MAATHPTLTRGSTNFETSGTTTLTLYQGAESYKKSANLIPFPMPASDSEETLAFDLLGVTREITIAGVFTTDDNPDIWKMSDDLDGLIQGSQGDTGGGQVGYTYNARALNQGGTSDRASPVTLRVYVNDVSFDFVTGEPNTLRFTVTLMEIGSSSA